MENYISNNILFLKALHNLNHTAFGKIFGYKSQTVGHWIAGKCLPSIVVAQKMCAHFEVSLDDFVNKDLKEQYKPQSAA